MLRQTAKSLIDSIIDLALEKVKKEVNEPIVLQDEITGFKKVCRYTYVAGNSKVIA